MEATGVRHDCTAESGAATLVVGLAGFVAEHYDRLMRLAWLVCRDAGDAADAVQLGLEQASRRRDALRGGGESLRPWRPPGPRGSPRPGR